MIGFERAVCLLWTYFHLHPNGYLDHWPLSKKKLSGYDLCIHDTDSRLFSISSTKSSFP
jgi:hypothetical protein